MTVNFTLALLNDLLLFTDEYISYLQREHHKNTKLYTFPFQHVNKVIDMRDI